MPILMKEAGAVFMNKICVVTKNKETYFIKKLIEEVGDRLTFFNPWSDYTIPESDLYFARTTGVYHNDLDLLMMGTLPHEKVINPVPALKRFRSKSTQYYWFEDQDIPALPWLSLQGEDPIQVEKFFRLYPEVVVKPIIGQGGWGVEAFNWEGFSRWWKKKKREQDESYLIQPLIRGASEFRVFFCKNLEPIVLKRKAQSGIAANFQKEGSAEICELPEDTKEIVSKLISKSGAFYGAIDLFMTDHGPYILELNTVPGIEQLEKITGKNMIKEILGQLVG